MIRFLSQLFEIILNKSTREQHVIMQFAVLGL